MENGAVGGVHVCNASGRGNWGVPLKHERTEQGPLLPLQITCITAHPWCFV